MDVVIEVLHSSNTTKFSTHGAAGNRVRNSNTTKKRKVTEMLMNSQVWITLDAQFYNFDDNEANIKMIIRSPMMRHVSRTHRVALDWLFDRINLDSKIQIKYVDTKKKQLADML